MRLSPRILIIGLLLLQLIMFAGLWFKPQKHVILRVSIKTIQAEFIRQLAEKKRSDEQVNQATVLFKESLKATLKDFASHSHAILLDSESILAGGIDCTEAIEYRLSQRMRNKS